MAAPDSPDPPQPNGSGDQPAGPGGSGGNDFPVVGIGASAGGLEAYSQLLEGLPAQPGLAIVIIQHLEPHHASMLGSLLGKSTSLPIHEAQDGMPVERNHIYVIAPNSALTVSRRVLHVAPRAETQSPHMPIDHFLRSLAEDEGTHAIGVLLSGGGTDGTLGMMEIKARGGITLAQDDSARHASMPRSAIAGGYVDMVLAPREIGKRLGQLGQHPYIGHFAPAEETADRNDSAVHERIVALLLRSTGVDFSHYKRGTVERRIGRRMALEGINDPAEYLGRLKDDPGAVLALYQDLLVRVTSFFRDREAFELLRQIAFPQFIHDRAPRSPIRVWVAGCATGEEAYSIAIALLESLGESAENTAIKILATDVSEKALEKARAGIYPENIELDVSQERLRRFFNKVNGHYQILKSVRDLCVFARHDLTRDPPFSRIDLVSCRNVLIYLDSPLHRRVLRMFHYALNPAGFLLLGQSEGVGTLTELFAPADEKSKLFRRKLALVPFNYEFQTGDFRPERSPGSPAADMSPAKNVWGPPDVAREADRVLLNRFAPAGVVVDESLTILQFRGDTSPFLAPSPGQASLDLLRLVRDELRTELRSAVNQAWAENRPISKTGLVIRDNAQLRQVGLEVLPIRMPPSGARCLWVLFELLPRPDQPAAVEDLAAAEVRSNRTDREAAQDHTTQLQQELDSTRAYLQSMVEEHEATNEELKSAHEEVLSSNEELQSMNEELQTAKEEMQSANEELVTINDELKYRNTELDKLNDDLVNLLGGVDIPIIMLSRQLCIRRFTPQAERLLALIPSDIGRPVTDIRLNLVLPDFESLLRQVIAELSPQSREVQDNQGHWWALRVRPYVTQDNKIDGVTIVALDVDMLQTQVGARAGAVAAARPRTACPDRSRNGRPFEGRVPGDAGARAPQSAGAGDDQHRHPAAPGDAGPASEKDARHCRAADRAHVAAAGRSVGRVANDARRDPLAQRADEGHCRGEANARDAAAGLRSPATQDRGFAARGRNYDRGRSDAVRANRRQPAEQRRQIHVFRRFDRRAGPPRGRRAGALGPRQRRRHRAQRSAPNLRAVLSRRTIARSHSRRVGHRADVGQPVGAIAWRQRAGPKRRSRPGQRVYAADADRRCRGPAGSAGDRSSPLPASALRILVVDDQPAIADSLGILLGELKHDVRVVNGGHAALDVAASFHPQAVVLDIGLPEMDGYEVARRLRRLPDGDKLLLIALTGYGQDVDRQRSREPASTSTWSSPRPPSSCSGHWRRPGRNDRAQRARPFCADRLRALANAG